MKCLSRTEMQEFVDREIDPLREKEISEHIGKCVACSLLFKHAADDKELINRVLMNAVSTDESEPIPEFIPPALYEKRITIHRFIPYIVAASLIGLIVLLRTDKQPVFEKIPEAELMLYEFYEGKDLNKMWHEKSQIIILQDEKGNVIQSIITN